MIRLSLDTETLGTSAGSQILQIACVDLDNPSDSIDLRLNAVDQARYGLTTDPATINWWSNQSKAVRDSVFGGTLPLDMALTTFAFWLKDIIGKETDVEVWMNSPSFDSDKILAPAFAAIKLQLPWSYYQERDFRTVKALGQKYFNLAYQKPINAHNALADAKAQGEYIYQLTYRMIQV